MGVKNRIRLGYTMILGLLMVQGLATLYLLHGTSDQVVGAVRNHFYAGIEFNRVLVQAERIRRFEKEFFIYVNDRERREHYVREWQDAVGKLRLGLNEIAGDPDAVFGLEQKTAALIWLGALDFYANGFLAIVEAVTQGTIDDPALANDRVKPFKDRFVTLLQGATAAATKTYANAETAVSEIPRDLHDLTRIVAATLIAAVVLSIVLSITVPKLVSRPIELLRDSARRMSLGDLEQRVEIPDSAIEFHELAATLERMRVSQRFLLHNR